MQPMPTAFQQQPRYEGVGPQLQGVVPPRGAGQTTVDLSEGFAPKYVVLARSSWERVALQALKINGQPAAISEEQMGDLMLYQLPEGESFSRRRYEMTWMNKGRTGAQFNYAFAAERPVPVVTGAQPMPPVLGQPGAVPPQVPMVTPGYQPQAQQFTPTAPAYPMPPPPPPPAYAPGPPPMPVYPSPYAQQPSSQTAPAYPLPPPQQAIPPHVLAAQGAQPAPAAPPARPLPNVAALGAAIAAQPAPTATEHESHIAATFGLDVETLRYIATQVAQSQGFELATLLEAYIGNFGSAGLEMVPADWIQRAQQAAQQTGLEAGQVLCSTVLNDLVLRMAQDETFKRLQKQGMGGAAASSGQDFVVRVKTEEAPPETSPSGKYARATGAVVKALAEKLHVDPGWLLATLKLIADARERHPDELVALANPPTLSLLRGKFEGEAAEDVDKKLAEAEAAEPPPEIADGEAAFAEPETAEQKAGKRQALIDQAIAVRSIDWIAQQAQVGAL